MYVDYKSSQGVVKVEKLLSVHNKSPHYHFPSQNKIDSALAFPV